MSNPDGVGVEVGLGKAVALCLHDARGAQAQVLFLGVWVGCPMLGSGWEVRLQMLSLEGSGSCLGGCEPLLRLLTQTWGASEKMGVSQVYALL